VKFAKILTHKIFELYGMFMGQLSLGKDSVHRELEGIVWNLEGFLQKKAKFLHTYKNF